MIRCVVYTYIYIHVINTCTPTIRLRVCSPPFTIGLFNVYTPVYATPICMLYNHLLIRLYANGA